MTTETVPESTETIHETVRQHYADAAVRASQGSSCCSDPETIGANLYSALERDELPDAAVLASLGCGNPTAVADLHPGERVLDLGSGGGIDVLLSAKRVGPTGRAFGVDMTDEMLALAQANAAQAGATNVEFLKGHIEAIPLPAESIDVVISNCVVNLAADKHAVFAEIARVLRPGGRIGISDIVAEDSLSPEQRAERGSFAGCIAGALSVSEFRDGLLAVGSDRCHHHPVAHRGRGHDQRHHQGIQAGRCSAAHRPLGAARDAPGRRGGRLLWRFRLLLMHTTRAEPGDWSSVRDLLTEAGLPLDGAAEAFATGMVVKDDDRVVGCAAIESFDGAALLRSVAVAPDLRGQGVGTTLVHAVEALARDRGATTMILLTETAEPWFSRLGYETIDRSAVPVDVAGSIEFVTACSTSAAAMRRTLA